MAITISSDLNTAGSNIPLVNPNQLPKVKGAHFSVTAAEFATIPTSVMKIGTLVYISDTDEWKKWDGSGFADYSVGGGSSVTLPLDATNTGDITGLGGAAFLSVGTTGGTVAAGNHGHAGYASEDHQHADLQPKDYVLDFLSTLNPSNSTKQVFVTTANNGTTVSGQLSTITDDAINLLGTYVAGTPGNGTIIGTTGTADNKLIRSDGTGGSTIQDSTIVVSDTGEISGYKGLIDFRNALVSFNLTNASSGKVLEFSSTATTTILLKNDVPVGFCCSVVQTDSGSVIFTPESGATLRNRQAHNRTAGQWAVVTLYVRSNSGGSSAEWVLAGDTTT